MYKVFLSSTSRDLAAYREAVHRAIDGLPYFQLVKMEDFGARDANAKDLCAELVGSCHLFVGIIGHYYGSCPPGETISYTELEYRSATTAHIPRLMFVAPDDFPIPATLRESDASFGRQQALRCEVMSNRVVASFATAEQLASAVTKALFVWHEDQRNADKPAAQQFAEAPTVAETTLEIKSLGPNPYRGLEAFRKQDADRFFGREMLVEQLWNAFLSLHAIRTDGEPPSRLITILGASGSGKSSVAQAGLLAELDKRPLPGRPAPLEVVFTPEARPLESLAVALARALTSEPWPAKKAIEFDEVLRTRERCDGLRLLTNHMPSGVGLILLVDQFEEIYSLCDDEQERATFIGNLLNAAREPRGRISIILTLRSDFLGAVNRDPELSSLIARQNVVVPVMGEAELHRAIEEPAKRAQHEIDPRTVALLVEQTLGREGALPLLEFVLTRIWEGMARGVPATVTLSELGGVGGALAKGAENVYENLDKEDREIARRAFLAMVRLGEGIRVTRRRARLSEIIAAGQSADDVLRVLRCFAEPDCRLITLADTDGTTTAEVAHEALFDHWNLLKYWLDTARDELWFRSRRISATKVLTAWPFRLSMIYLALLLTSALVLLGVIAGTTAGFMERQTADVIQAEIQGLAEQYRTGGLTQLRRVIDARSAGGPQRGSVYVLADPFRAPVAGNIERWPQVRASPDGWLRFTIEIRGDRGEIERHQVLGKVLHVGPGFTLLVGRDIEERLRLQGLVVRAIGWGLGLTLLLGLAGGFLMSRNVLGRVEAINRTVRQIMAGDLSQRIALKGSRDEFDQLAANLNAMLDRIEQTRGKP